MKYLLSIFIFTLNVDAFGWGGRGHDTICQAAVFLVKDKELSKFLRSRPHVMGHLCNIPDTQWRDLAPEQTSVGNPSHFVDADLFGSDFSQLPEDYHALILKYEGKPSAHLKLPVKSFPNEFGSNWWRADQFFRRAVSALEAKDPFGFFVNLGIMGHFVGDNAQPMHLTVDYDGYFTGHGGLHSFYEEQVVSALSSKLQYQVANEGDRFLMLKKIQDKLKKKNNELDFLKGDSVVGKMKALGILSYGDLKELFALDKVLKPSEVKEEKGMKLKTPAVREAPDKVATKFEPLIIKNLGRGAALLATLWEEAYRKAGSPNLSDYKSPKYPLTVDFVAPDYLTPAK